MKRVYCLEDFLSASENENYVLYGHDNMIFLYSKDKFNSTGDMIKDLKIIIGYTCAMDPDMVNNENVYHIVYSVFERWVSKVEQKGFWFKLFSCGNKLFFSNEIDFKDVIFSMLTLITLIQMKYDNKELHFTEVKEKDLKKYY
jgi:hypothetical protein